MPITLEDIKTALKIIDQSQGGEVNLRFGDVTLIVRRGEAGSDVAASLSATNASKPKPAAEDKSRQAEKPQAPSAAGSAPSETAVPLKAPLTGVIYRAPSPEEPPFVQVGAVVGEEDNVCIIDVMKVMNLIKAPAAGKVSRIDVENEQMVTKGDVVLWVEPA